MGSNETATATTVEESAVTKVSSEDRGGGI